MKEFIQIFNKVGGKGVLKQYRHSHVLFLALMESFLLGLSKKSLELVRIIVENRLMSRLRKEYKEFILDFKRNTAVNLPRQHADKVWVCWLQGMENAPELVQKCYHSLQEHIHDKEIVLLTQDNVQEYVQFPDHIQQKIDTGIISKTHMSDLLRLELLIRYGGTWMDSTVFCSGSDYPDYMLESDLFFFQCLRPGFTGNSICMSSWMMTASANNHVLMLAKEMIYDYWKKNNEMFAYALFHFFLQLALEAYPREWKKVIPFSNSVPHILLLRLFEPYNADVWNSLKRQTCFHKLSYKREKADFEKADTYYNVILG